MTEVSAPEALVPDEEIKKEIAEDEISAKKDSADLRKSSRRRVPVKAHSRYRDFVSGDEFFIPNGSEPKRAIKRQKGRPKGSRTKNRTPKAAASSPGNLVIDEDYDSNAQQQSSIVEQIKEEINNDLDIKPIDVKREPSPKPVSPIKDPPKRRAKRIAAGLDGINDNYPAPVQPVKPPEASSKVCRSSEILSMNETLMKSETELFELNSNITALEDVLVSMMAKQHRRVESERARELAIQNEQVMVCTSSQMNDPSPGGDDALRVVDDIPEAAEIVEVANSSVVTIEAVEAPDSSSIPLETAPDSVPFEVKETTVKSLKPIPDQAVEGSVESSERITL